MGEEREAIAARLEQEIRRMAAIEDGDPDFSRATHLFDYGYLDSFGAMELVAFGREAFGVEITDAVLATRPLNTVDQIADFVAESIR